LIRQRKKAILKAGRALFSPLGDRAFSFPAQAAKRYRSMTFGNGNRIRWPAPPGLKGNTFLTVPADINEMK